MRAARFPDQYDDQVRKWAHRYLGRAWTWHRFWAQGYQESLFNCAAVSHAGARGCYQFMPGTWREVGGKLGLDPGISPHSARHAIRAGAFYMADLYAGWTSPRPDEDRKRLAEASYNCGFGCVLRAQRRANGAVHYADIAPHLPDETRTYIERIQRWTRAKRMDL